MLCLECQQQQQQQHFLCFWIFFVAIVEGILLKKKKAYTYMKMGKKGIKVEKSISIEYVRK